MVAENINDCVELQNFNNELDRLRDLECEGDFGALPVYENGSIFRPIDKKNIFLYKSFERKMNEICKQIQTLQETDDILGSSPEIEILYRGAEFNKWRKNLLRFKQEVKDFNILISKLDDNLKSVMSLDNNSSSSSSSEKIKEFLGKYRDNEAFFTLKEVLNDLKKKTIEARLKISTRKQFYRQNNLPGEINKIIESYFQSEEDLPDTLIEIGNDLLDGKLKRKILENKNLLIFVSKCWVGSFRSNLRAIHSKARDFYKQFSELEIPKHNFSERDKLLDLLKKAFFIQETWEDSEREKIVDDFFAKIENEKKLAREAQVKKAAAENIANFWKAKQIYSKLKEEKLAREKLKKEQEEQVKREQDKGYYSQEENNPITPAPKQDPENKTPPPKTPPNKKKAPLPPRKPNPTKVYNDLLAKIKVKKPNLADLKKEIANSSLTADKKKELYELLEKQLAEERSISNQSNPVNYWPWMIGILLVFLLLSAIIFWKSRNQTKDKKLQKQDLI